MIRLLHREHRRRLWLAETVSRIFEASSRTSDILRILALWCDEILAASRRGHVAIFLSEGDRWLRVLPEIQNVEVPVVPQAELARACSQRHTISISPVRPQDPRVILAPFFGRDGWSGALMLWSRTGSASRRQLDNAAELADAIGRTLTWLRRSEASREESLAAEKARWASELHDGFLQSLLSAKLHAEVCQTLEAEHDELCLTLGQRSALRLRSELARTHALLEETVRQVRSFLLEQRSFGGAPEEFLPWLRAYAEDFTRENAIQVEVRVEGEGELSTSQAADVIRLVREALTNVRKHAQASSVRVVVAFSDHGTTISVSDNGVGFDVRATLETLLDSSHNGLIGLRYRTESIGGVLRMRSEPGRGTTLQFRLPRVSKRASSEMAATSSVAGQALQDEIAASAALPVPESIRAALAEAISTLLDQELAIESPPERSP